MDFNSNWSFTSFFFKSTNRKFLDAALGFTGGVMIAASFWSLLSPAIDAVEIQNGLGISSLPSFLPPAIGFFLGAMFMYFLDKSILIYIFLAK